MRLVFACLVLASLAACASSPARKPREAVIGTRGPAPAPMAPREWNRVRTEPLITPESDPFAAN